ncbi:dicarboxylate/amino acid:cation symporter [Rhizorhabdus wittichii]|uniref:Dicarboxylate/amino acid:cation symporter n=1 Tax=Rhizorhabdus wittichii TaxID=160791 RepID=A0A975HCE9_9SPHN|nr:dicarboxylate/amino acid:cation symporter [Rhizorhabdus wittichii]QTH20188.1 dicarboxylate/amino acid:cation symporter [Rhizorhabdus wittichii]
MWKAVLWALVAGIGSGAILRELLPAPDHAAVVSGLSLVTEVFLRLIKMIIAPLVFSSLVTGIAHMGDTGALGRIGLRTLGWFLMASAASLMLGILLVNLLQPGVGLDIALPDPATAPGGAAAMASAHAPTPPGLRDFVANLVPKSAFEALAMNNMLQIVIFSAFFGAGLAAAGRSAEALVSGIEACMTAMIKVTGFVMRGAPIAVFAAVANTVLVNGVAILTTLGLFVGGFYFALIVLWLLLMAAGFALVGRRIVTLVRMLRNPVAIAFSAASSEAAFPQTLSGLTRFGVPRRIASFVLPLGYSFNLDGSMMYCSFAVLFVAQAYGIEMSAMDQVTMLLLMLVTSKGMAAVPRASLVIVAATLAHFHIPEAGLLLIMAVDQFLDMGRSATNVIGNAVATVAVARWEGELPAEAEGVKAK